MDTSCLNDAVGLLPDPIIRLAHYLHDVTVELEQGDLTTPYANTNEVDERSSKSESAKHINLCQTYYCIDNDDIVKL